MNKSANLVVIFTLLLSSQLCNAGENWLKHYNVIWNTPSKDPTGQMPIGNGDLAAGVYAIEDDALYLLLAKNDAFTYNGDIFKTGRVKISLSPNPFSKGNQFKQTLDLYTGSVLIETVHTKIRVWADAHNSVYHVQITSDEIISVFAEVETWNRFDNASFNRTSEPLDKPTQDVVLKRNDQIISYYAVGDRSVYPTELKYYEVEHMASIYPDPYRFNTFGNLVESPSLKLIDGVLSGKGKSFDLRIHSRCKREANIELWIKSLEQQATRDIDDSKDWNRHCEWWKEFWNRSWITITDNKILPEKKNQLDHEAYKKSRIVGDEGALVAQSYNVFRYLMACQSRGRMQTKFNGGLFTQPLRYTDKPGRLKVYKIDDDLFLSHEDDRLWGRRFTFMNQRLLYWPSLMSGDADLMKPFFNYYWNMLPVRKAINKAWFGHEGAYFRENIEPTGGERDCAPSAAKGVHIDEKPRKTSPGENTGIWHHAHYFTSGLEIVAMMIAHAKYSEDKTFSDEILASFAREILTWYDQHYERDERGKIRLDPSQAVETWWMAVNPATDVSGLLHNLDELIAMNVGTDADQEFWKRFREEIPEVHLREIEGRKAIAPGQKWSTKKNSENPEFYPVFPFRRFGLGMGNEDIVDWTMQHRLHKNSFNYKCWTQDQVIWAYAGNAWEAKNGLIERFKNSSLRCRFPLYGSESPDACPDLDHFGVGSIALQRMLVQEANGKILLLPAWPGDWDAEFKLHVSGNTVIQGKVEGGKLKDWSIHPQSRKKDVVIYETQ
ncbi:MAG: DUF5703 domain-containing protein [Cytophagales bacterium]|nr:DUF5703 domain-containing protein [Cytophagales bacterium]